MSKVSVSEAARLVRRDRKTLYKDIKSGRLSATLSATGAQQVDIAELVRVYGDLATVGDSRPTVENPQEATQAATQENLRRLAVLEVENAQLRARLEEKDRHIEDMRNAVRLLEHKSTKPWWRLW